MQAVHQESDVIPENIDAIRVMMDGMNMATKKSIYSEFTPLAEVDKPLPIIARDTAFQRGNPQDRIRSTEKSEYGIRYQSILGAEGDDPIFAIA